MTADDRPKPARRRRASGSAAAGGGQADVAAYQRCVWQQGTGWQPLSAGEPVPDDRPVAWCSQIPGGGWSPMQPSPPGEQPAMPAQLKSRAGHAPSKNKPADHAPSPATPPAAPEHDLPGAGGTAQPSPVAAPPFSGTGAGSLPPEVAAFYALLYAPLPPVSGPQAAPSPQGAAGASSGPSADAAAPSLWDSFRGFTARLGDALNQFVTNVSSLEVDTYTSTNPSTVHLDANPAQSTGENLALVARTLVAFDGDTQLSVPAQRSAMDPVVIQMHMQMVHEAQYNRAQFLQMMGELGSQLLGVFKPK